MTEDRSVLSRSAAPPDAVLAYGDATDQVVDLWYGDADRPLVVLVHGGFWRPEYDRTHLRPMAEALRAVGWPVAAVEYRREPGRPDDTVGDVRMALQRLPDLLGPGRHDGTLILVGHSAGGHLALLAATDPAPWLRGVLALAPVADVVLADRLALDDGAVADFLGVPAADRPDLDPARLAAPPIPVTLLHGTDDARVPLALSESYAAAHPDARLVTLPGASHFTLIDPETPTWPPVTQELTALHTPPIIGPF